MKKIMAIATVIAALFVVSACTPSTPSPSTSTTASATSSIATSDVPSTQKEIVVFAAASMTDTLTSIAEQYKTVAPDVKLTFNFDSSGTLKTQIEEGADCDIFISASPKQMNELDVTADSTLNPGKLDYVLQGSREDLLENTVALVVPKDNPAEIKSFDDLQEKLNTGNIMLAIGNADVPVGQYAQKIFTFYGLDESALSSKGALTYGSNVKEVTKQVEESAVDCGIVYSTDAVSAGLDVIDRATAEMCGKVLYPIAVMKNSKQGDAAQAFVDYLKSEEAAKVFELVGFSIVK